MGAASWMRERQREWWIADSHVVIQARLSCLGYSRRPRGEAWRSIGLPRWWHSDSPANLFMYVCTWVRHPIPASSRRLDQCAGSCDIVSHEHGRMIFQTCEGRKAELLSARLQHLRSKRNDSILPLCCICSSIELCDRVSLWHGILNHATGHLASPNDSL